MYGTCTSNDVGTSSPWVTALGNNTRMNWEEVNKQFSECFDLIKCGIICLTIVQLFVCKKTFACLRISLVCLNLICNSILILIFHLHIINEGNAHKVC